MKNLENSSKLIKIGMAVVVVLAIGSASYWLYDFYTLSQLTKIPVRSLDIVEEQQLRADAPRARRTGGLGTPRGRVSVYVADSSYAALDQKKANLLAKEFGFRGKPSSPGQLLIWREEEKNFVVSLQNQFASLEVDAIKEPLVATSEFPSKERVSQRTKTILKKLGLPETTLDFDGPDIQYKAVSGKAAPEEPDKARVMEVEYSSKMKKIEIYGQEAQPLIVKVQIGSAGKLLGFTVPWAPLTWGSLGKYPLKNTGDALKEIEEGGGSIVRLTTITTGTKTQQNKSITAIGISEVKLGYYAVVGDKSYLVPIYIFSGKAELASKELTNVSFYVIAIPDKFLQKNKEK